MAFLVFPVGTVLAHLNFLVQGVPCQTSFGFRKTDNSAAVASDGSNLALNLSNWWGTNVKVSQSNVCSLNNITVLDMSSASGWEIIRAVGVAGTNAGSAAAAQVALVVTQETGIRGRSYRGRNYWMGLTDASRTSPDQWSAAAIAQFTTAYGALPAAVTATWTQVVLSRYLDKVLRTIGHAQDVIAYAPKSLIATVRGRLT